MRRRKPPALISTSAGTISPEQVFLAMRLRAMEDLYYLCTEILEYPDFYEPYHRPVCNWYGQEFKTRYRLTLLPRGFYKTTIGTCAHPIQLWLRDPMTRILRIHFRADQAETDLSEIKDHFIHREKLRDIAWDICFEDPERDSYQWLKDRIYINRPRFHRVPSFLAVGMGAAVTGFHFDWFKPDDLVTIDNYETPEQLDIPKKYIRNLRPMMLNPTKAKIDVTGTRWNREDVYGVMMDPEGPYQKPKKNCIYLVHGAIDELGNARFPTKWPLEELELAKQDMGPTVFAYQMLNLAVPDEARAFEADKVLFYDEPIPVDEDGLPLNLYKITAVDPNRLEPSQGHGDPGVITTFGCNDNHFWELETDYRQMGVEECALRVVEHFKTWRPRCVVVETTAGQNFLVEWINKVQMKQGVYFTVLEASRGSTSSKGKRKIRLEPIISGGRLHLRRHSPIFTEIKDHPFSKHDHGLDALADVVHNGFDPAAKRTKPSEPHGRYAVSRICQEIERTRHSAFGGLKVRGRKW